MKHSARMAKYGAHLQLVRLGKRASVVPNKKKKLSRKACRKKIRA